MTSLLQRAAGVFLIPEETPQRATAAAVPAATRAVVVGTVDDVPPLAAAVALALRAADRSPAAAVAVWSAGDGAGEPPRGAAAPAASRLAARISRRGLTAAPRGRLAWVALPAAPSAAIRAARDVTATVDGPVVIALAGPRPASMDALVDDHDLVVAATEPGTPLATAAVAAFADRPVSTIACAPVRRGLPRALALAGIGTPRLEPPVHVVAGIAAPRHRPWRRGIRSDES